MRTQITSGQWKYFAYTLLFGVLCLALDSLYADVVITPLLSLCWLLWVARTKNWKIVCISFGVLFFFVFASLMDQSAIRILVRCTGFLLTGSLAVAFSRARQRSTDAAASALAIIRAIPTPIVVADMTGAIVTASDEISSLLPEDFLPVVGHSFADVFMGNLPPGRGMKKYLDWFHINGTRDELLFLRGSPDLPIQARILTTGEGRDRLLVAAMQGIIQ